MNRLKQKYQKEIISKLMEEFGYKNYLAVARILKVVLNVGLGEATENPKVIETVGEYLSEITGQKPATTRAHKAISGFKIKAGQPIGVKVTLRGDRMYTFLDKLFNIVLPRVRDFKGVNPDSFDTGGNFSLGIREQMVFPEVTYSKIDKTRGLEITIVTNAKNREESKRLLELLGAPFKK